MTGPETMARTDAGEGQGYPDPRRTSSVSACPFSFSPTHFHEFDELVEEILGVVGSRSGFGMVLDGEHRKGSVLETFHRPVIEIPMRHPEIGSSRNLLSLRGLYGEAMVL